ncbi:MAG: hypothetical protein VB138_10820 [Burkholderia sp.]
MTPLPPATHAPCPTGACIRQETRSSRWLARLVQRFLQKPRDSAADHEAPATPPPVSEESFAIDEATWRQVRHLWHV